MTLNIFKPKEFKSVNDIRKALTEAYSIDDFRGCAHFLIFENDTVRVWVLSTKENIYFVLDDKDKIKTIYTATKQEFHYTVEEQDTPALGQIWLENAVKPIPYDKGITGSTATFQKKMSILTQS